jgi:hypothetical protein
MKYNLSTGEVLHFTEHQAYRETSIMKGKNKMQGMCSLNTSSLTNAFCQAMSKNVNFICHSCYARKLEAFRKKIMRGCFDRNGKILEKPLRDRDIPQLDLPHLRFNAFGELEGKYHYFNYVKMAEANPTVTCVLWTKREDIIKKHKATLPNLIHIYSAPRFNVISGDTKLFDKIFTVYNKKYIEQNNVNMNCEQFCIDCLKCYTHNDIKYINEKARSA